MYESESWTLLLLLTCKPNADKNVQRVRSSCTKKKLQKYARGDKRTSNTSKQTRLCTYRDIFLQSYVFPRILYGFSNPAASKFKRKKNEACKERHIHRKLKTWNLGLQSRYCGAHNTRERALTDATNPYQYSALLPGMYLYSRQIYCVSKFEFKQICKLQS